MVTRLSQRFEHLYFPIDWKSDDFSSRAIAYMIARDHNRLVIQLTKLFHDKLPYRQRHHVSGRQFSVGEFVLTREQVVEYLHAYRNPFQLTIAKQLAKGLEYQHVQICNPRFIINSKCVF